MIRIKNQEELIKKLQEDVNNSGKNKILFLSGHFPLIYSKDNSLAVEAFNFWGVFSVFTLEIACIVAKYAKNIGKEVGFVLFVDDHAYEDMSGMGARERSKRRSSLYLLRSGQNAVLPDKYKKIMAKYGFSEKDVLRHNHFKDGRSDCLYFSEKILRLSRKKIDNLCAKEYTEFIDNEKYFDKEKFYMISFIPNRCRGHICNIALGGISNFSATHVAMETMSKENDSKRLFMDGLGVSYTRQ